MTTYLIVLERAINEKPEIENEQKFTFQSHNTTWLTVEIQI